MYFCRRKPPLLVVPDNHHQTPTKRNMDTKNQIIAKAYEKYNQRVISYVHCRIKDSEEAFDIMQDVFVRVLDFDIVCEETVKSLIFTIANSIVIDHIRRHYKRQEVYSYIYDKSSCVRVERPDDFMAAKDIEDVENALIKRLSPATARVYEMTRMKEMTIEEIATELSLSKRTVECHQFKSRKFIREQMRMVM